MRDIPFLGRDLTRTLRHLLASGPMKMRNFACHPDTEPSIEDHLETRLDIACRRLPSVVRLQSKGR
jgi:hypothetical protein